MKIGFDAKRAYSNNTGLGHYSRTLIKNLAAFYPTNEYVLFAPKITNLLQLENSEPITNITPFNFLHKKLKSIWRSVWVKNEFEKLGIDIYHGLSHEIPFGVKNKKVKTVVTIHDLIFERYPEQHGFFNTIIYRKKFKYACKNADAIIAISEQTKKDIIDYYKTPSDKITVCYQTCNPMYTAKISDAVKQKVKLKYNLPEKYLLWVGSITERKNLLIVCKALKLIEDKTPLVVIGNGGKYKEKVKQFLVDNQIEKLVIFLSESNAAKSDDFKNSKDFPAIYQMSSLFIYTSIFEGFGIPILEAMYSGVPVIASNTSCMPETGGDAAMYVNPSNENELKNKIELILKDEDLSIEMIRKGIIHAQKFSAENCTDAVMKVYKKLLQ